MIIESVQLAAATGTAAATSGNVQPADFSAALESGLQNVNRALNEADGLLKSYSAGNDVAVHDLVIAMEKARFSLQLTVEVRNRLVESYQEFMRMQI